MPFIQLDSAKSPRPRSSRSSSKARGHAGESSPRMLVATRSSSLASSGCFDDQASSSVATPFLAIKSAAG